MFIGEYVATVDPRGRIYLPAQIRREIDKQNQSVGSSSKFDPEPQYLYLLLPRRLSVSGLVRAWGEKTMKDIESQISRLPKASEQRRVLELTFLAGALRRRIDENGRIMLSTRLLQALNLENGGEVSLAGVGEFFEICSLDERNRRDEKSFERFSGDPDANDPVDALLRLLGEN